MDTLDAPDLRVAPHRRSFGRRVRPGSPAAVDPVPPARRTAGPSSFGSALAGDEGAPAVADAALDREEDIVFSPAIDGVIDRVLGWETPGVIGGAIDRVISGVGDFLSSDGASGEGGDGGGDGGGGD